MKLVIIDYGLCNLRSVSNALQSIGVKAIVSDDPTELASADCAILPGVGAFEDGMKGLRQKGFIEPLNNFVKEGKPFLGICLGMQLLMTKSYEFGEHDGLNFIEGEVVKFKSEEDGIKLKIPHIGWNHLYKNGKEWENTILEGLREGEEMYFIHSYSVAPCSSDSILAKTFYRNQEFCSVVHKENIYGCQFHPEKSSTLGIKILDNFINLTKEKVR